MSLDTDIFLMKAKVVLQPICMRFDARSKLQFRVITKVLMKHRNPDETEEIMVSDSSKNVYQVPVFSRLCQTSL